MKKLAILTLLVTLCLACLTPRQAQDAREATDATFSAAQLACVFGSSITDPSALAKACRIVAPIKAITTLLLDLIGQREGARQAGVLWRAPSDAGSPPPSDAAPADAATLRDH